MKVVDGYGKSKSIEVEVEDDFGELEKLLIKLFLEYDIKWEKVNN